MEEDVTDLRPLVDRLQTEGIENPWKEVRHLVAFITRRDPLFEISIALTSTEEEALVSAVLRRATHEPLTKIVGEASFWKHRFLTNADTLDPRPESELFIETVLRLIPNRDAPLRFLDLGTGTGCLLLSCLEEYPQACGVGADVSSAALSVAQANAERLGTRSARFVKSNWNESVVGAFDVILSNPPYIREGEELEAEVRFDPALALFGGKDGLEAYRAIFRTLARNLIPNSFVLVEIGKGQQDDVAALAQANDLTLLECVKDWQGIPRLLVFRPRGC